MFDIWEDLADLVQVNERKVHITNAVFILHSKVTVIILLALSILVTSRQYLGDPIDCISSPDIKSISDNYCWIHSTFTRAALITDGKWGYEAVAVEDSEIAPGIRPTIKNDAPRIHHTYYQWVWLVLFLQAGLFYLPYWLWRLWDRGRIKLLVSDLNLEVIMALDDDKMVRQKEAILEYITPNSGRHSGYATQYVICEMLNTFNVIAQIFLTDAFLNFNFSTYGFALFTLAQRQPYQRSDDLARVSPTVTACRIATGGVAFGTMEYDILCINILNEKIYIFLWFWFLGLAFFAVLNLMYRLLLMLFPPLRRHLFRRRLKHPQYKSITKSRLILDCSYSDWFMLSKLGDNLNPVVFAEILEELNKNMSNPSTLLSIKRKLLRAQADDDKHRKLCAASKHKSTSEQPDEESVPLKATRPAAPPLPITFLSSAHPPSHSQ